MNRRRSIYTWSTIASALMLSAMTARADEFGALPGLWKTTLRLQSNGDAQNAEPQVEWHCVDEDADPWIDFSRLPEVPVEGCERKSFERTATTLKWQYACHASGAVTTTGSIVFDSPQHYTGSVETSGSWLGYPLRSVVFIEGERRAACTSPKD